MVCVNKYNIQNLIPELLHVVPEIKGDYDLLLKEFTQNSKLLSKKDLEELKDTQKLHDLPQIDYTKPGITLVVEDLLMPYIVEISLDPKKSRRLFDIMNWIEELVNSNNQVIVNMVSLSICEPLLTSYQSKIKHIQPFMGVKTKFLCKSQLAYYKINKDISKLFDK